MDMFDFFEIQPLYFYDEFVFYGHQKKYNRFSL